jgi:hypothetical protein
VNFAEIDRPPTFDWRHGHSVGDGRPCRICLHDAFMRDETGTPCHKVCAELEAYREWMHDLAVAVRGILAGLAFYPRIHAALLAAAAAAHAAAELEATKLEAAKQPAPARPPAAAPPEPLDDGVLPGLGAGGSNVADLADLRSW